MAKNNSCSPRFLPPWLQLNSWVGVRSELILHGPGRGGFLMFWWRWWCSVVVVVGVYVGVGVATACWPKLWFQFEMYNTMCDLFGLGK